MDLLESSDSDEDDLLGRKTELSWSRSLPPSSTPASIGTYRRLRMVSGIEGFVVNVHDPINYDIDLKLTPAQAVLYQEVIGNTYTYCEYGLKEVWDLRALAPSLAQTGKTYRCRLRGIGSRHLTTKAQFIFQQQIGFEIKSLVDRADGWITAVLSDIDIYHRLLIDVVVHLPKRSLNLRQYILKRIESEPDPIFYPYRGSPSGPS